MARPARSMATDRPPAPTERPPRSFWFDPRFGVGIALVLVSVTAVSVVVTAADRTERVWAARETLTPGDTIGAEALVLRDVRLDDLSEHYLAADELPDDDLVVTRVVSAGELVPVAAVGTADSVESAPVVITVTGMLARSIRPGASVDIWATRESGAEADTSARDFGPPSVLVAAATVVRVIEREGIIVGGEAVAVEILVPRAKTASVLEAVANGDALSLVPLGRGLDE